MTKKVLTFEQLNALKIEIYGNAVAHGFHDEKLTVEHCLGLVLSEIGEAINADRNPGAPVPTQKTIDEARELADEPDEQHVAFIHYFKEHIKGSVVEELADVAMRLLDLAGSFDVEFNEVDDLEVTDWILDKTLPVRLFAFAISLERVNWNCHDHFAYSSVLDDITNIANNFTHLNLWQVVRLKMLYNNILGHD